MAGAGPSVAAHKDVSIQTGRDRIYGRELMNNVGTVPMFKMNNVGTVLTWKMQNIGTAPIKNAWNPIIGLCGVWALKVF